MHHYLATHPLALQAMLGWAGIVAGLIVAPWLYRLTHGRRQ